MKICTCNNCGNIYEDMNPGDESIEYKDVSIPQLPLFEFNGPEDTFYGCNFCETDEYLVDNININAMSEEQKQFGFTIKEI